MSTQPQTLAQWLAWMESHHPRAIELGLERVAAVMTRMQLDLGGTRVISVAGTNGKGSCVAAAVAALTRAGLRVGSYTSPHLLRYNERVCVDGYPLDDDALCRGFERVYAALGDVSLTYFEFGTLAALAGFEAAGVDVLVLEVGLGGRLDAVNVIDSDVAVITSIDLDHRDWLGDDRDSIGVEKAGIARAGRPLVCADPDPPPALLAAVRRCEARLLSWGESFGCEESASGARFYGRAPDGELWEQIGPVPQLAPGSVSAALQALVALGIELTDEGVGAACRATLAGRFEHHRLGSADVVLDVAHNPAAARQLVRQLEKLPAAGRTLALFGIMADKDVEGVVVALRDSVDAWFVAHLKDLPRAVAADELAARIHAQGIHMISVSKNLRQAWRRALSMLGPGDRLLVCGSFHVVGPVSSWLESELRRRGGEQGEG